MQKFYKGDIMKKKILSFLYALCLVIPCAFLIAACGGSKCEHEWYITRQPSMQNTGATACSKCGQDGFDLPKFNDTDYEVVGTNPDYKIYKYTKDGKTYDAVYSNFEVLFDGIDGYTIAGYQGNSANIVIPEIIIDIKGEKNVTRIGDEVFLDNTNITSVTLPDTVTHISNGAFRGCTNLATINLPEDLFFIGNYAFANTALTSVVIPSDVSTIGASSFEGCNHLQEITVPFVGTTDGMQSRFGAIFGDANSNSVVPSSLKKVTVTGIENYILPDCAFEDCAYIEEVVLGEYIPYINLYAFQNCTSLKEIVIPSSVTNISWTSFVNCTAINKVYYGGTKEQWDSRFSSIEELNVADKYYYSENQPTGLDYIVNNRQLNMWHYNENNEKVLWTINETNNVDNKTFVYAVSQVDLSDVYWAMLQEAKSQGILGMLFDNDTEQIEMVTSSATKEEYEGKLATYYASYGSKLSVAFADGVVTLEQTGDNAQLAYVEIDGEVYYTTLKTKAFTYDATDDIIYEELVSDYYTIRHNYSLVTE